MAERRGSVWYRDRPVGSLREDHHHSLRFAYTREWLEDGFPISIRLPLANGLQEVDALSFFSGLLPEGHARQRICRQQGIDVRDDAGLLFAIGEDCAGALSILPSDAQPRFDGMAPEPLPPETLRQLVVSKGQQMGTPVGGPQRFSLAGAQDKLPVIFAGGDYALPNRANPSSHILKFETVPGVCFAEYVANDMARRAGLPVVETEYLHCQTKDGFVPFLRIRRYDRDRDAQGHLYRLHQEDTVQALGEFSVLKYQRDGGPSIGMVANLLRENTARPVEAIARLRDWQIFNCLIGNWDGHGKNLALLYAEGQTIPTLAPFYDLVAIEYLNLVRPHTYAREMAFFIGEHDVPERISRADWEQFARSLGMPPTPLFKRLEELAAALPEIARQSREAFAEVHGHLPVHERLVTSVERRCNWVRRSALGG